MGGDAQGEFPDFVEKATLNAPRRICGNYLIRFRNTRRGPRSKKFLRGYGFEGDSGTEFNWDAPGFGEAYKRALRNSVATVSLGGYGEVLPRWENYVQIDRKQVDVFGIPVLEIHMAFGENEFALVKEMAETGAEMLEVAGAKNIHVSAQASQPGWAIHEVGVARMGNDPKKSVLNRFQQTHDVKNLFVMDGSGFTTSACQNPTLTIMALCVRSCDVLMQEMKRGNI